MSQNAGEGGGGGCGVSANEYSCAQCTCTDNKENQTFLKYKEIQKGSVAKSYLTIGLLIYG